MQLIKLYVRVGNELVFKKKISALTYWNSALVLLSHFERFKNARSQEKEINTAAACLTFLWYPNANEREVARAYVGLQSIRQAQE